MIGIVIVATNAYFILGLRFMMKFMKHYKGSKQIMFHFFSDTDPKDYLPDNFPFKFYATHHTSWVDGTNSKFKNILSIESGCDYLYYFDADTNVSKDFDESWFLGDLVGGEHYANRGWMKDNKGFDRNPKSKAYIPHNTTLPQCYYYGAFFGGTFDNMMNFCQKLQQNQIADKLIGYEPSVNDESYINQYFHFNPPTKTVPSDQFMFDISDKGGLTNTRKTSLDISDFKEEILRNKGKQFDIINNKLVFYG